MSGWIGVDLDGTLAEYHGWVGDTHIGPPVPSMVARVRKWLDAGLDVRVFTARVNPYVNGRVMNLPGIEAAIKAWCEKHVGRPLPVTYAKDFGMIELWDDRCVQVEPNTGRRMDGKN